MILTVLVFYLALLVTMVYGPIAAFLVEIFPARIRYTSMSLPYHVGNGVFGGGVPFIGGLITTSTGVALSGLIYPLSVAAHRHRGRAGGSSAHSHETASGRKWKPTGDLDPHEQGGRSLRLGRYRSADERLPRRGVGRSPA